MPSRPLLLGHRGARAVKAIRENTFASFDLALAHGCDGFEFDVRLTANSEAVVCHDPKIGGVRIAVTNAAGLPQLPLLRDVLRRYGQSAFLDIEIKVSGMERAVVRLLRECRPSGYVVSSFLPSALRAVHAQDPSIPLGMICETKSQLTRWRQLPVNYVIVHHKLALRSVIYGLRSDGRKVLVWTVNGAASMRRLAKWGVDGIISDDTERLAQTLGETR